MINEGIEALILQQPGGPTKDQPDSVTNTPFVALENSQKHQDIRQNPQSRHTIFTLCLPFTCLSPHNQFKMSQGSLL